MADTSRPSAFSSTCGNCKNTSEENIIYPHPVSLCPELIHEPVHPLLVELQRLGRVGQVRAVDHVLENLDPVIEIVEHEDTVASDLLGLEHGLEVGQQLHVLAQLGLGGLTGGRRVHQRSRTVHIELRRNLIEHARALQPQRGVADGWQQPRGAEAHLSPEGEGHPGGA